MATKDQKNQDLATKRVTGDLRVPDFPKLSALCNQFGFKEGMRQFEEQADKWRLELEKAINERGIARPEVPSSELG